MSNRAMINDGGGGRGSTLKYTRRSRLVRFYQWMASLETNLSTFFQRVTS